MCTGVPKLLLDLKETLLLPLTSLSLYLSLSFHNNGQCTPNRLEDECMQTNEDKNYSSVDIQLISAHSIYSLTFLSYKHCCPLTSVLIMPDKN